MMKNLCLVPLVFAAADASTGCDLATTVFADMHDGDQKEVTIKGSAMTIKPHGSDQEWVVNTQIDCSTKEAEVDFNVPGKDDHPPVPIYATQYLSLAASGKQTKTTFIFNDKTGTLNPDATFPLNQWVGLTAQETTRKSRCPDSIDLVFNDEHDGDMKQMIVDGDAVTIKPSGNDQVWTVNAKLDRDSCSAMIDFNVPGKDDHPPVPILGTFWVEYSPATPKGNLAFEFTDTSGQLSDDSTFPLNRWVQLPPQMLV